MKSVALLGVALWALMLAGCTAIQKGETVVKYEKDSGALEMIKAPDAGEYALYSQYDAARKTTVKLDVGDKIGFEKTADGKINAIGGSQTFGPYADQSLYWKRITPSK